MEKEENTVDPQDEQKDEETFEVDETEEEESNDSESDEESSDNEENSTQYQEELKEKEAELAKYKRLLKKYESGDSDSKPDKPSNDESSPVTKADLERIRLEAKGYDDDQVNFLMRFGGSEALQDEAVQSVVNAMAEKKKQVSAQASGSSQGKTARRYSQDELRAMPGEKLEKLIKEGKIK